MNGARDKLMELNEQLKRTKRIYKKVMLNSKIKLIEINLSSKNCVDKIENSIREDIEMISGSKFNVDESLTKIYSLIDKTSYILKSKPSKLSNIKHYFSKVFKVFYAISTGMSSLRIFFARKFAFPPILYSKSFAMSINEARLWHKTLYSRLTSGFKDFNRPFLEYKSELNTYKFRVNSSKTKVRDSIASATARGKASIRKFFD